MIYLLPIISIFFCYFAIVLYRYSNKKTLEEVNKFNKEFEIPFVERLKKEFKK